MLGVENLKMFIGVFFSFFTELSTKVQCVTWDHVKKVHRRRSSGHISCHIYVNLYNMSKCPNRIHYFILNVLRCFCSKILFNLNWLQTWGIVDFHLKSVQEIQTISLKLVYANEYWMMIARFIIDLFIIGCVVDMHSLAKEWRDNDHSDLTNR